MTIGIKLIPTLQKPLLLMVWLCYVTVMVNGYVKLLSKWFMIIFLVVSPYENLCFLPER